MKKIFLWGLSFLLVIAIIPFSTGVFKANNKPGTSKNAENAVASVTDSESILTEKEVDTMLCQAMEYIKEETDKETKIAILSLCVNNYMYNKNDGSYNTQTEISNYSDNLLQELTEIYNNGIYELRYKDNIVYIPLVVSCPGYTVTSDEYPYIQAIASPWDTFVDNKGSECGISLFGIEYLCKNYKDAESTLRWYLPEFEIKLMNK